MGKTHLIDSQYTLILNHLKENKQIDPNIAYSKYGCYRLGAVIYLLRGDGYNIQTEIVYFTKPSGRQGHYAVYRLEEES